MKVAETFFSVSEETRLFLLSCLFGFFLGVVYDIFRAARLAAPHNSILVAVEDIAFLLLWGLSLTAFASAAAKGQLRGYFAIGNILGFMLYLATVGRVVIGTLRKFLLAVHSVFGLIFKPIRKSFVFLRRKAERKFVGSSKIFVKTIKKAEMLLPKTHNLLYNKTENKKRKNVNSVVRKKKFPKKKGPV